jgi:alkyl hydroperoxide reductase subunit AhpC
LEKTTAAAIRRNREEITGRIRAKMIPDFEAFGVKLIDVSIDSIETLERVANKRETR